MGVSETTTHMIIKECDEGRTMQRKSGGGRPAKNMKKIRVRPLIRYIDGKVGVSQRQAAKKFGVSLCYAGKIMKDLCYAGKIMEEKSNIRYFRRQPVPAATEEHKKADIGAAQKAKKKEYINIRI